MNPESPPSGGSKPGTQQPGTEGAQTVPLMPPMAGYVAAQPTNFPPGWAPPGFNPYLMPAPGMPLPPGWPPGYPPPPQMYGYPAHYPGTPPGYPLPPVAAMASPAMMQAQAPAVSAGTELFTVPLAEPAVASVKSPVETIPDHTPTVYAAGETPSVRAVATEEPGMTPILRLGPSAASASRGPNRFVRLWKKVGAGSLMLSLIIHGALLAVAGLIALTVTLQDKQIDFLPGGGTQQGAQASAALSEQVKVKQRKNLNKNLPKSRLVSTSISSTITLPEAPPDMLDVPDVSSAMGGGKLGSSGYGFGGAGGGFGNGIGSGGLSGMTFKPLMMFGIELKDARKIAVVMDVSRSMTKYLPIVVKELDKVAKGSPVVMYFGCGLANPPKRKSDLDDKVRKAEGDDFASFWQNWEGKTPLNMPMEDRKKLRYDPAKPMPLDDIYQMMSKRKNTHYIEFNGIGYAWMGLMSDEVKEADAVYWFADFQDKVDEEQMEAVRKRFKARKQKLFIHASVRGRSFERVRDNLVLPLDGEVIETELPKK